MNEAAVPDPEPVPDVHQGRPQRVEYAIRGAALTAAWAAEQFAVAA